MKRGEDVIPSLRVSVCFKRGKSFRAQVKDLATSSWQPDATRGYVVPPSFRPTYNNNVRRLKHVPSFIFLT
jgi:hypothetical protein